jgi:hypothetical protein
MSDKLLTFSRHKNKTRNAATLGPASWQEEHQVLALPANQRTSRSVTVLLSAVWRVFDSRLGQYFSNSLVGVIKKPGGVVRDSERCFTGWLRMLCCGARVFSLVSRFCVLFCHHIKWTIVGRNFCYQVVYCTKTRQASASYLNCPGGEFQCRINRTPWRSTIICSLQAVDSK